MTLKDICHITTGKLDANAMVEGGKYPFYTCAEIPFAINEYAFDTEALLISGNGANLGYINYYNGRFNAYQRTYVLDAFTENIHFVKCVLKVMLPKRIAIEKSTSNTPYIVMSTLAEMKIFLPSKKCQNHIANLMCNLEIKLHQQTTILKNFRHIKSYLLQQMFI
ncbi:restriction endonuclease subunit S [Gabonibacter chumensis]|uniref:restriction endonuclease subunit S n=1 Tax=Gabonibacter chumensis TaxID=2972474 RepID=UPI0025744260|nr:restriction endonuclease subunit S [Gabonibacter chumensis]